MYNEQQFLTNILDKAQELNLFDDVVKILIDANIVELPNLTYAELNPITLKDVCKIEALLGIDIITIPTDKEWVVINRKRKIEHLNNINDDYTNTN